MEKVYPETFYMTVYEDFKRKDGKQSYYSSLMFNPSTWSLGSSIYTKEELKKRVEEKLSKAAYRFNDFTVTETPYGWKYERFIKWEDEDSGIYVLVEEGQHSDHEVYTVDISYYENVRNVFARLR